MRAEAILLVRDAAIVEDTVFQTSLSAKRQRREIDRGNRWAS
jgi:hypothetical protein